MNRTQLPPIKNHRRRDACSGTGYANPDAVTSIGNGLSTTTYSYDNNGNLTQVGSTTYLYDYLNRITSLGTANSTSSFGYDAFGACASPQRAIIYK